MTGIRWEGYSHEEIYRVVHTGPGRAASVAAESSWAEVQALILRIDERITAAMNGSASGWEGGAADAARTALSPLAQWASDAANDAGITARAVTTQAEQAQELRNTIPEPPGPDTKAWAFLDTITNESMGSMEDLQAAEQEEANRAARAVDLMNTYTNNSFENRRHMDYWTLPPQVTVETAAPPAPTGVGAGAGGGFAPGDSGPVEVAAAGAPAAPGPGASVVVGPAADAPPAGNAGGVPVAAPPPVAAPGPGAGATGRAGGTPIGGAGLPPATLPAPGTAGGARSAIPPVLPPTEAVTPSRRRGEGEAAAVRPVIPGPPPRPAPAPGWRDVVASTPERPAPGARAPGEPPVASEPPPRSGVSRGGAALPGPAGLYPPMAAGLAGSAQEQEHRRPDYLIDDTDAFADDRWFPGSVITPDDVPPRRR
ncbi:hypothetical protein GCM10009609_54930 [Pseudonocardia aurantiaca]|uniref:PPE domain-containing protein n=1 Tax=Pseudonocardia aurantiaca TaxID=75290 RepID=UPI0031E050B1